MRGDGRVYLQPRSAVWWSCYYLRGKQYRESTGETDEQKARKFLRNRLKEVHADELGVHRFTTPQACRLTVQDLVVALKADYQLRGKLSGAKQIAPAANAGGFRRVPRGCTHRRTYR